MVSTSSTLACYQCGFESWSELGFSVFRMWHFLKLVVRGFLRALRYFFTPLTIYGSASRMKLK